MEISTALWGGFSSFFSIWQVCFLQISPFYMAFIAGLFLATIGQKDGPGIGRWVLLPFLAYAAGFTVFYSLLIASGLGISRLLLYNVSDLRLVSGIVILLVSPGLSGDIATWPTYAAVNQPLLSPLSALAVR